VLVLFQAHPEAWTRVDAILAESTNSTSKFLALTVGGAPPPGGSCLPAAVRTPARCGAQVLENVIKFRWRSLPQEQREGIRSYLVQTIIKVSAAA
jgi:exportin-1